MAITLTTGVARLLQHDCSSIDVRTSEGHTHWMRFFVLGPIEVETADGLRDKIGSAKQRAVLAMLLSRRGSVVAFDELIDGLWGDNPPPSAMGSLRTYVSRLRQLTGDQLVGHDDGYSLSCAAGELDAVAFEDEVAQGRYSQALKLWRGRPYGDASDLPAVRGDALRLETLAASARSGQLGELLTKGKLADAISGAEARVLDDPVDEAAWAVLVSALARSGRIADALRAFQRASDHLAEAGLAPNATLRGAETEALSDGPISAPVQRHLPPTPLAALVGRAAEVERLIELTATRRLVTIVGPGGVGKTRLSVEVARHGATRHALGARVVELSRVSTPDAVAATIRRALDLTESDAANPRGLGHVDALIVLDNCEHVIDAVVAEIPTLLAGGDELRILATSRQALGVAGEQRWAVAPLSTVGTDAPALTLFVERARDAAVEIDPSDPQVQSIVAHLDGLPLALEMAAARLPTMGLANLADEVQRSVASLGASHRGAPERHDTLRAVLEWSEALLGPDLRVVLADFSMFAGPVAARDLPAAVDSANPLEAVCALADRSLITADTTTDRALYGSLETIRQYGRERLTVARRFDSVAKRHARWFAIAAEEAAAMYDCPDEARAVTRFDAIFDELRAAHHWSQVHEPTTAIQISLALFQPGFQGLRLEVFDWALALAQGTESTVENAAQLYAEVAHGLTFVGRFDAAQEWAERAISATDDPVTCRAAYGALADMALYTGDLEQSLEFANTFDALAQRGGTRIECAYGRASVGLALAYLGRHEEALAVIPETAPPDSPPSAVAWLAYVRGEILLDIDPPAALRELDRAIIMAESVGNHFLSGVGHVSAASLRARTSRAPEAIAPFAKTIQRLTDRGNTPQLLTTLRNLPTLLARLEACEAAAEILGGLASNSQRPSYGEEARRLGEAAETARSALGDDVFAERYAIGAQRALEQTARRALVILDELRPR